MEGFKIFNQIKEYVINLIKESKVSIEDFIVYGDKKVDIVLTTDCYAISISILSDYTYDCFVVEISSDEWIKNHTKYHDSINNLFETLREDIVNFINL